MISCGQPFFFNTISTLTNVWFGETERITAVTILSNAISFGNLLASLIPGLIFGNYSSSEEREKLKAKFSQYLIICSSIVSVLALPLIFVARNAPPTPPS